MALLAVTVIGRDRPGIIAEATGLLAGLGANLEDSSMTLLRGHFAMVLVASADAATDQVEAALAPLAAGGALDVAVREMPVEDPPRGIGAPYLLSVHGGDRPGIVSAVTAEVAAAGGNVTDLTTRLSGDLYVVVAEVDLAAAADAGALGARLAAVGAELGVQVSLRPVEPDLL
ncbi:MAG TPA: ACT domain-containing protein [Actinomycetes bacterium]|nr:ACT domain-containing protein [Actinomycetes bacterium]